ncbi:cyclic AMP-responsive element-binding protein 3-like protein 4 [Spea bombifrons]|uniref:cyclic AMP-responsive element-binding protein 3-like protein 4 n=1 Tax=Spea bombifrons TaxID=233779 RepID=UPI002349DDEB|nr:cyclic AMP-responsive element-binding protein 3-like protein 4 [Spea bombifrons]XP_053331060.1 cyclic AMP-responsive element-binding protein 3-like protein 4 [Spea bombifrons]
MEPSRPDLLLGSLFEQQEDLFPPEGFSGSEPGTFSLPDSHGFPAEKLYEEWPVSGQAGMREREDPDDFLQMMIDPNEVYSTEAIAIESPESDSGFSDDPQPDTPVQCEPSTPLPQAAAVYELVYDVSSLEERNSQREMNRVISIQLEDWHSPVLIPDGCIVNELPTLHTSALCKPAALPIRVATPDLLSVDALYPELHLTDEEKRLLSQEGVALPSNLPLTKAEERILKRVRRKIRNKQSAQDSRRRKKEYIDGLESRVAACSAQNQELHKKVVELEKHNISLITQLRKLQTLIKQTSNKAAQTGTCVMILLFSLALLIFPSYSPLRSRASPNDVTSYRPTGVISRNILNKVGFSEVPEAPGVDSVLPEPQPEQKIQDPRFLPKSNLGQEETGPEIKGLFRERQAWEEKVPPESTAGVPSKKAEVPENADSKELSKTARGDEM